MIKKVLSLMVVASVVCCSFSSCGSDDKENKKKSVDDNGIRTFSAFFAVSGSDISSDNRIMNEIAKKTKAKVDIKWLAGQSSSDAVGTIIATENYPDFIDGSDATQQLIKANALVPIDEYWDDYPNIKNYFDEVNWEKLKQEDGHIYIIPQFDNYYKKDTSTFVNGEAFWIQIKVLKWANYPKIKTLDEYFDLIERYLKAHPNMEDGKTNHIGYEILTDQWKYFCLENPPFFLDGYPNDGCCIIDPKTITAKDYNFTPTAKKYFKKLNEMFHNKVIDDTAFTLSYDQYLEKISQGRVLGMCDQYWNFQAAENTLKQQKKYECEYIPLDITIDGKTRPHYYAKPAVSAANGLAITTACKEKKAAFQFVNDLLSKDIMKLRFWGEEGKDYYVKENGKYARTPEQRANQEDQKWIAQNWCTYSYFPYYSGMCLDDTDNAYSPGSQKEEFYDSLSDAKKECLDAYGAKTVLDLITPAEDNSTWYPMWSFTNKWDVDTDYGIQKTNMDELKHTHLPNVIMSDDFEKQWQEYKKEYDEKIDIDCYLNALTTEARRRDEQAKKMLSK